VWAFITDEMDAAAQQTIVDYVTNGGNAVIYPYLPDREMSHKPCTILRDAVSVSPFGTEIIDSPLIDILGYSDIKCSNPLITCSEESLTGAEIIARTIHGSPCGFSKPLGRGSVTYIGTWIGFDTAQHKLVYEAIMRRSDAKLRQTSADNDYITVRERFTDNNKALLFVANYYNEDQTGRVTYTHPETGEDVTIPMSRDVIIWPALYGVLTPVCLEVSEGLKILHSTSDILGFEMRDSSLQIVLGGDRDLTGEIVFEGKRREIIQSAEINGKQVDIIRVGERIILTYSHEHRKEMVLNITII